ncbi:hypothetical protein GGQ76_003237 [Aureimonas jatrophae]|uniref:Uncharacterized protein n=1 Tax=Aureimonas jatrophae TaxID=1166073 RepID=A0A1H0DJ35_9HYPH|nr:hypothetical protein [Aureimonas jatrophae]MBB3951924.1 hypothetical protein [Aureimonas jatrophae]SDN70190.1 hypothetical protein SAMN05192530_101813 [Aureimonas jatrophae]
MVRELDDALADIEAIRRRVAAGTVFRGLGPLALAATALIALGLGTLQTVAPPQTSLAFFLGWIVAAVICVGVIAAETMVRAGRAHGGLADAMLHQAIQTFLPAGAAGAAFAAVVGRFAPDDVWMIPGVWQVFVGLGLFAATPSLPRGAVLAAAWYFTAGFAVMMLSAARPELSPWAMALPFAVGQAMLAVVVHRASLPGASDV